MSGTRGLPPAAEFGARVLAEPLAERRNDPAMVAGSQMMGIGELVTRLANRQHDQLDLAAQESAWEAGTVAGEESPGAQMEGGGRIVRTAFNRAAADTGQRRLELMARTRLTELAEQHATDPTAFNAAAAQWRDGIATTLPAVLAGRFRAGFDTLALPQANQIGQAQRRHVADQAVASWTEALPGRIAGIEQAAGRALEDPAAANAYRAQEDQAIAELVALGPREAFTIGGRQYPADPSRTGALNLAQVARQAETLRATGREAVVIGAWRDAGGGRAWIDQFERGGVAPSVDGDWTQRNAASGRPHATPQSLAARVPAAWQPIAADAARANDIEPGLLLALLGLESGGRAGAVSRAGATGPAQIMPDTAARPGFGMEPLPADALTDPARAIPWATQYLARLRDHFGGDMAKALAAYNAGPGRVEQAAAAGRLLPEETRNYLATLLPAAGGHAPLPDNERQRIASRLRGLQASDDAAGAEGRADARAELTRHMQENMAAIGVSGRAVRPLDPDLVARAGEDLGRLQERERAGIERYAADQTARHTTDPAELAALGAQFAPGTENFRADPGAAVQLLNSLRARGVTVAGAGVAERMRDLDAEAKASGRAGEISAEEATAAGLAPEQRAQMNREVALTAELARLRTDAEALPPGERQAAIARFPVQGDQARENALRVRIQADAFTARDRAVAQDPAGYVLALSPALRQMATEAQQRLQQGDLAGLPALTEALRAEQTRIGVPAAQQRALPVPMLEAMTAAVADARDPVTAASALRMLSASVGLEQLLPALSGVQGSQAETRREAMAVAAAVQGRDPALARQILTGTIALREGGLPGVSRTLTEAQADTEFGNAFRQAPAARAQAVSAATALYAAEQSAAGRAGAVFDASRFREALSRVAPMTRWDGQRLPLPPSMDDSRFRALLSDLPPAALAGAMAMDGRAITPAMVARGGFELLPVGVGLFELRYGGDQVVAREGGAFRLDLTAAAAMPAPERAGRGAPPAGRLGPLPSGARRIEGFDNE